jgi:hypothetical protein
MSLILAYHNESFGAVLCDGRVSKRLSDGSRVAMAGEVGKKFAVLKSGLVLAGSSSHSAVLDLQIFALMHELVRNSPELSYEQVASLVPVAVANAESVLSVSGPRTVSLILLGYDSAARRVRNVSFAFTDGLCEQSEYPSGAVACGFIEPEERVGHALLERMGDERTESAVLAAMESLAADVAATRPNVVGPPYFTQIVRRES